MYIKRALIGFIGIFLCLNEVKAQNTTWPSPTATSNVGIGTSTAIEKLTVAGKTLLGDGTESSVDQNDVLYLQKPGYVQMHLFQPSSGVNAYLSLNDAGTSTMANGVTTPGMQLWTATNHRLTFGTSSTERLSILGNGNIGIGTSAPTDRLDVNISNDEPKNVGFYTSATGSGDNPTNSPVGGLRFSWYNSNFADIQMLRGYGSNDGLGLAFLTSTANNGATTERMRITTDGKVAIGTTDPKGYQLAVNGSAVATSVTVKLNGNWPDYVFRPAYQLRSLQEVQTYIDQNRHLPEMPSEEEIKDQGVDLGEMVKLQTKKIEELTLYLIEKDKQVKGQQEEINELKEKLEKLIINLSKKQ